LRFLIGLTLVAATLAVYRPVCNYSFVNLDDPYYVQDNPLVRENPLAAFTTIHAGYWIPLTWISYQIDYQISGLAPGGYHRTNLLLHAANVLLLFILLCRLTGATLPSGFAAALFALHPLQVESVAWVTERKDVLSTFFGLLALHAYAGYAVRPSIFRYLLVMIWLALGLLAKPMLVTLPFVMLLIDYWPLNRLRLGWFESSRPTRPYQPAPPAREQCDGSRTPDLAPSASSLALRASKLFLEKLPIFALAVAASIVTIIAQHEGNAVRTLGEFSLTARVGNALLSFIGYLEKIVWPFDLAVFYPHPGVPSFSHVAVATLLLAGITGLVFWRRRQQPFLLVGWLWFAGTLIPVSGVVQAGWQGMADRFLYVPSIGLFVAFAFTVRHLTPIGNARRAICTLQLPLALAIISLLILRSANQVANWRDSLTLWEHASRATPDNFYTRFSYGAALLDAGRVEEAAEQFVRSVELKPDHPFGHYELGLARREQGRMDEAIACWTAAVRLAPDYAEARLALAEAQARRHP
jgi:tetratricopeptide (TPR) repeat protein